MTLRLVLESAPCPQAVSEWTYEGGQLSIGRSEDVDWQLDDPEMYLSRRHCILSEQEGRVMVTDASSGGLYIDNAAQPLGAGNSVPLEPGMRLRLGDFTLRVETPTAPDRDAEAPPRPGQSSPFDFGTPEDTAPPPPRPDTLPDPFGERRDRRGNFGWEKPAPEEPRPLDPEDPFGLDLRGARGETAPRQREVPPRGYFAEPGDDAVRATSPEVPSRADPFAELAAGFDSAPDARGGRSQQEMFEPGTPSTEPIRGAGAGSRTAPAPEDPPSPVRAPTPDAPGDPEALLAALRAGLGLDPQTPVARSAEEMEQLGRSMRALVEGVMLLLRTRAQERQKVRIAQTIIASTDVNPLKFLASSDEALEAVIRARGRGYLEPDRALSEAFHDLADHQVRTWSALQLALRRMIDRFDPEALGQEMREVGLLESVLAGGRSARLWQLYEERYREIARAAEEQFLGEVGADFREAYETRRRE